MARSWVHRILERPMVYRLSQSVLGAGGTAIDRIYDEVWRDVRGLVLDVGCGPTVDTPRPDGAIVGLDVNPAYIRRYVEHAGTDGPFGVVASAAAIPFADAAFDECRSAALLHHLPDESTRQTIREMYRTLRPGGRLAIFDMIRPRSFLASPLGWLLCNLDRGAWVRQGPELQRLAAEACSEPWESRMFSYSWAGLRGIVLLAHKKSDG